MNEEEIMKVVYDYINNDETKTISVFTVSNLVDLYKKEKEKNKELDFENQALYESINCDDDNMLARRYQKIKEENDFLKLNGINLKVLMEMRKKFIAKDRLRELREIDNIDLIQYKIKELLEE